MHANTWCYIIGAAVGGSLAYYQGWWIGNKKITHVLMVLIHMLIGSFAAFGFYQSL